MSESPLLTKSKEFSLEVISACRALQEKRCEYAMVNQLLRSGTSIGANIREAFSGQSRRDFVAKLYIALKECTETQYWLELLEESKYTIDTKLMDRCIELKKLLIASVKTAKNRL